MRLPRAPACLLGAFLLFLLVTASPVDAHAVLLRSEPSDPCGPESVQRLPSIDPRCTYGSVLATPPSAVRLWFSEPVEPFAGGITVLGPSGRRVDRGPPRGDRDTLSIDVDAAEEGTYLVRWRVVSADTHPTRGSFTFSVVRAGPLPGPGGSGSNDLGAVSPLELGLQVLARWLHELGFALGFGSLAFLMLVLRPLRGALSRQAERRLLQLAATGVVALVVAELLGLLAESTSLAAGQGLDPELLADALASSFGRVLAQRLAAALLLWTLLSAIQRGSARAGWAALAVGAALAVVDGEASHAGSGGPLWLGLGANAIHVVAMGVWVGGLVSLLAVWRLLEMTEQRRALLSRFAVLAPVSLLMLLATGALMAVRHLPLLEDLRSTAYGRALDWKLALVLCSALLALVAARAGGTAQTTWWKLEAAALLAVLVLAGLLVSLPPPR